MNELILGLGNFFQENFTTISVGSVVAVLGGGFTYYIVKKVIPKTIDTLLLYVSKIVSKMFGVPVDGVSDKISELPIMAKMNSWESKLQTQNELKLLELKNKIVSPKLSDGERIAYQAMFDKIMLELGESVSTATRMALAAIDKAASDKLGL